MEAKTYFDAKKKLWKGEDIRPIHNPEASLGEVLLKAFTVFGSNIAQINHDTDERITYDEMKMKTIRAAQNLQKLGCKAGQVLSFISDDGESLYPIIFASFCIGCPINILAPESGKIEICHLLRKTKPVLMFSTLDAYNLVKECLNELNNDAKIYTFDGKKGNSKQVETLFMETGNEANFKPVRVNGLNNCAAIVCSSGTTGLPKGICKSDASLINDSDHAQLASSDVFFCVSNMSWAMGVVVLVNAMLHGGTHIITKKSYTTKLFIDLIENYKITYVGSVPQLAYLLLKSDLIENADLSSVKYFYVSGSTIPTHLARELKKYLPNGRLLPDYGLTEIGVVSWTTLDNHRDGSVGQVKKRETVKIVDQNGRLCGINEIGEIFVKPYFPFLGYFDDDEGTKKLYDEDGFFYTADIGYFDEDGFLFVVDRNKDLIRYAGEEISPSQIENFLLKIPEIKSVCVVGITDEIDSELLAAMIVRFDGSTLSEQYVSDMVYDQLGDLRKLRGGVYFVDSLPTTTSRKVNRGKVREIATEKYKNRIQ